MKATTIALLAAALGLLAITADQAQAQTPSKINLSGTTYVQGDGGWVGDVYTSRIEKIRVNTKDLLDLFAEALGRTELFPRGSYVLQTSDRRVTVNYQSLELADVSPYFIITADPEFADLEQINYNEVRGNENSRFMYPISFRIGSTPAPLAAQGGGIAEATDGVELLVSGIAFESFKAGAVTPESMQPISISVSVNVSGDGAVDGRPATFIGKITAKGRTVADVSSLQLPTNLKTQE